MAFSLRVTFYAMPAGIRGGRYYGGARCIRARFRIA